MDSLINPGPECWLSSVKREMIIPRKSQNKKAERASEARQIRAMLVKIGFVCKRCFQRMLNGRSHRAVHCSVSRLTQVAVINKGVVPGTTSG